MKQKNDYFCGPVSSANTIKNISNINQNNLINELAKLEKTTKSGTTINNLCKGIDKYYQKKNMHVEISYYGIIDADAKYQKSETIELNKLHGQGIINIGFYRKTGNVYVREEGHFVSLVEINEDNGLIILDPYNKTKGIEKYSVKKEKLIVINKDKYETFTPTSEYYLITTPIDYLENDESAIINGIILLNIPASKK